MPRKPISKLTPEEAEARRKRDREVKAKQREGKPPAKDPRGYRGAERIAKQRARIKAETAKKT